VTQSENLPDKYNPYKAAYHTRAPQDPVLEAQIERFWERMKSTSPKLYQKHQREEAAFLARRPIIEAMLDDPEIIAMIEQLTVHVAKEKQTNLVQELSLLGIAVGATKRDIRNAYRRKARKLHPDVGGDPDAFKQLHDAYRALLKVTPE